MATRLSAVKAVALALEVAQRWPVFPCNPLNKKPMTSRGFLDATRDRVQITRWWKQHPNAMIGVPTGEISGFWVVDVDVEGGDRSGAHTWREWTEANGIEPTRVHRTPRGGMHYLFLYDSARPVRSSAGKLHQHIDIRGDGGYVVVPPSISAEGKPYEVARDLEIAAGMDWIYEKVAAMPREKKEPDEPSEPDGPVDPVMVEFALRSIPADSYDYWYKIAGFLRRDLGAVGRALFVEWSRKSSKFNLAKVLEKWEEVADITRIGVGSVFMLADEHDSTWRARWEREQQRRQRPRLDVVRLFPIEEQSIRRRPWLVYGLLMRRYLTLTAAPGGSGKSILTLCVAVMCALGTSWACWRPRAKLRTLIINAEEDIEEQQRRAFAVAAKSLGVRDNAELSEWILIAKNPSDITVARLDARRRMVRQPLVDEITRQIIDNRIDVVIVDPFAETFEGEETNAELKFVGSLWREVARKTDTAIWLIHHTKKYASEMAGDIEASRGGTALGNIVRLGTTMFPMTREEAANMGVPEDERRYYIRFDDAKANYLGPSAKAQWFRTETCHLQNTEGDEQGDNVGVLQPWDPPAEAGLADEKRSAVLSLIDRGMHDEEGNFLGDYYTLHRTAVSYVRWVGILLMRELKLTEHQVKRLIKEWVTKSILVEFYYKSSHRKPVKGCGSRGKAAAMEKPPKAQGNLGDM